MNIIQVMGNLGSDPVTRFTATGQKVTSFNVATNVKKGEATITNWYRITIWGDRFEKMMPYLKKGSSLIIIGELQKPEIWTDKEGRSQIQLEIWADILRFSPFGTGKGTERSASENANFPESNSTKAYVPSANNQPAYGLASHQAEEMDDDERVPF